jgi:hypothetical protein
MVLPQGKCSLTTVYSDRSVPSHVYVPFNISNELVRLYVQIPKPNTNGIITGTQPDEVTLKSISLWKTDAPHTLVYFVDLSKFKDFTVYLPPGKYKAYSYSYSAHPIYTNREISFEFEIANIHTNRIEIEINHE